MHSLAKIFFHKESKMGSHYHLVDFLHQYGQRVKNSKELHEGSVDSLRAAICDVL